MMAIRAEGGSRISRPASRSRARMALRAITAGTILSAAGPPVAAMCKGPTCSVGLSSGFFGIFGGVILALIGFGMRSSLRSPASMSQLGGFGPGGFQGGFGPGGFGQGGFGPGGFGPGGAIPGGVQGGFGPGGGTAQEDIGQGGGPNDPGWQSF